MATRRQAREWALQMLFQIDHNPVENLDQAFIEFWKQQATAHGEENDGKANRPDAAANAGDGIAPPKIQAFTERVVRGVIQNREAIDQRLTEYVKNWPLHRMGGVERNVMRLALYELFYDAETPPVVCINEAVDLAKYFSNADAGKFVNGILDRAAREARRPAKK
ncbi:MAG: transcription antitermination factor NusB [Kiritimatiellia bacterium]